MESQLALLPIAAHIQASAFVLRYIFSNEKKEDNWEDGRVGYGVRLRYLKSLTLRFLMGFARVGSNPTPLILLNFCNCVASFLGLGRLSELFFSGQKGEGQ